MRATLLLSLALLTAPASAFTVACLGDSNTAARWGFDGSLPAPTVSWCERLREARPEWTVRNYGWPGACALRCGLGSTGGTQLTAAVADGPADVVVVSFGTNDLQFLEPAAIVEDLGTLATIATATLAPTVLLAATPPRWTAERYRRETRTLNSLLRRTFGRPTIVDFDRHVRRSDLFDGLHVTDAEQAERMVRALDAIERAR